MSTFFMNLTLPQPRIVLSPAWATQLNAAITSVDSHDHTSASGQRLTTAGINVNASISLGEFSFTSLGGISLQNRSAVLTVDDSVFNVSGEWYFRDDSSNNVQLTSGGAIDFSGFGGIGGDYSSTAASLTYSDTTKAYTFEDSDSNNAGISVKDVTTANVTATGVGATTFGLLDVQNTASLAAFEASAASITVSGDAALNGNNTGRGIIPVGGVVALASNITGVPSIPTGFSALDGSTISDGTSPMDGVTLPNINNSVFLAGSSTSGTTGGVNSYTLNESQIPSHTHTINHGHSDNFALVNATVANSTHTHNMAHAHQYINIPLSVSPYGMTTQSTIDDSVTKSHKGVDAQLLESNLTDDVFSLAGSGISVNFIEGFANDNWWTTGALSAPSGSGSSATTGAVEGASTTITVTGSVTTDSDSSGSIGSGSSIDNKPNFISTQYIVRIK